ncbi:MAG TPA: glycine cleavage system protein GcvH [bacterium]|nr:glycine cleavage system protein GcvH [bacterium]
MATHPDHLRYTASHEYVDLQGDIATIGITQHATEELGDVVYVELPKTGAHYNAGDTFGVVESVKAVSDLYMPVAGTVTEANTRIEAEPALVNQDPYALGWFVKLRVDDPAACQQLLTKEQYEAGLQ